ncbi:MAG: hypothetical protein ACI4JT_10415 [Oscillospiraceae bacterium]
MKKSIFAIILAAILLIEGCSANPDVSSSEPQTAATESTTASTGTSTTVPESQNLPGEKEEQKEQQTVTLQAVLDNALEPVDWINHLENDLMKFWNKSGAKDMSDGLFPTYLSAKGEKLSDLEELPEEIKAALECDDTKGIIDLENNYVRAHSRLTYAYGIAYHMTGKTEYLELCRKGAYALSDAFDSSCGGMYTRKNIKTDEWDSDKNARTSQDLAYGITGMGMYYFLTRDEFILEKIIQAKNYIFSTYYDEEKGYFTWYPKSVEDNQTQLVAQLDQLYAYMLMLTPCLPEPYKSEWKSDMKNIADILIERFYSENNLFWGVVNDTEKMSLGGGHNDFGHSVKTLWVIEKVGQIIDEPFYIDFARSRIKGIIENAYLPENGTWASRFKADGTLDKNKEWWIYAELDQAAEIMSINNPMYYEYLNNTQRYWLNTMTDKENGEIWHYVDSDGNANICYPKTHCWKTSLHSFEHALFSYMTAAQLKGEDFELYYAFPEDEKITANSVEPYMFSANMVSAEKGESIEGMSAGSCVYKVVFNQLY